MHGNVYEEACMAGNDDSSVDLRHTNRHVSEFEHGFSAKFRLEMITAPVDNLIIAS